MSSNLRYYNQIKPPTKFQIISTPSYTDSILGAVPIPFSYHNGVLDINLQDDVSTFIANGTAPNNKCQYKVKEMGGTGLVTSIGPNLRTYLDNFLPQLPLPLGATYSYRVQNGGIVTKVQYTYDGAPTPIGPFAGTAVSFAVTTDAPIGDQYVYGAPQSNYQTAWVFKNPVTIKAIGSAGTFYINFFTTFSNF